MKHRAKFREEEKSEQNHGQEVRAEPVVRDFGSMEELLRYDREGVEVPERLEERIRAMAGANSGRSWWRRIMLMGRRR